MLYTAKGTASLRVPIASIASHYDWQAVFVIAIGLNAIAAPLALFVTKPMRRAFSFSATRPRSRPRRATSIA
jgi:OFA family oxalate/formate antiporter-like MFS transporter